MAVKRILATGALALATCAAACGGGGSAGVAPSGARVSALPPPSNPHCPQAKIDGSRPPATARYIYPREPVVPFYQWENNDGYCGEVSLIQAGLNAGQWMSQLEARLVCGAAGNGRDAPAGAALSQSGPDGFCAAHGQTPDYNAQLLLEASAAANADTCLSNARLAHEVYDGAGDVGLDGYRRFMAWVKNEVIAGHQVTIGVLIPGGGDPLYDHIVSVMAIGTNHAPTDASYHDDDVLYFDDHGAISSTGDSPAVPPGTGSSPGCAPYVYGYTFGELPRSRKGADSGQNVYAILIPGVPGTRSYTGGDGVGFGPSVTGRDHAFSVSGPADDDGRTLPVVLRITGTTTAGVANPPDAVAGFDYESPFIGESTLGDGCTNEPPPAIDVTLEATVSGLSPGARYHLYEYDLGPVSGTGRAAALAVPTSGFNARAAAASSATTFTAAGSTFVKEVSVSSRQTVVFRAVPDGAP